MAREIVYPRVDVVLWEGPSKSSGTIMGRPLGLEAWPIWQRRWTSHCDQLWQLVV